MPSRLLRVHRTSISVEMGGEQGEASQCALLWGDGQYNMAANTYCSVETGERETNSIVILLWISFMLGCVAVLPIPALSHARFSSEASGVRPDVVQDMH
jgi:hypothetical protein